MINWIICTGGRFGEIDIREALERAKFTMNSGAITRNMFNQMDGNEPTRFGSNPVDRKSVV